MVKDLACNAGDVGSIPGLGTKISGATEQLSLRTATRAAMTEKPVRYSYRVLCTAMKDPA